FHGKPAPPPQEIPDLFAELLETVNSPVALETWPAPARAFGLHFLLRLVQPLQAPAALLPHAAEAMLPAPAGLPAAHPLPSPPAAPRRASARSSATSRACASGVSSAPTATPSSSTCAR